MKIEKNLKNEDLEELSFKKIFYTISIQKMLNCSHYNDEFWKMYIPSGPFSKDDINHLKSSIMEFYYFFQLQMILYSNDQKTLGIFSCLIK